MLEERIVMKTNEEEDSRHIFRGELALVIAVMINSLAVILMLYSDLKSDDTEKKICTCLSV